MKTAISLPDTIFKEAELFARLVKKSRSQLYAEAIEEYLARHAPDAITEAMNKVCDCLVDQNNSFGKEAANKLLKQESW
jgi:metal-responsive CopG/Arc/MetJ family transcriptional regulator